MASQSIAASILTFPPRVDPMALEHEGIVQLSRTLAYAIHSTSFDRLTVEERHEAIELATVAWHTVQEVLSGKAARIPEWERQCLTFSGPYDLALLQGIPQSGGGH
jgi:hypothetical protein